VHRKHPVKFEPPPTPDEQAPAAADVGTIYVDTEAVRPYFLHADTRVYGAFAGEPSEDGFAMGVPLGGAF
jgi:hypothetical protein